MGKTRVTPKLSVRSLGGTAAMVASKSGLGATPTLSAKDLVAAAGVNDIATIDAASVYTVPGASLTVEQIIRLEADLEAVCAQGSEGVVVVQGTDTLEETSYLMDVLWRRSEALVFTGAMRPADASGADGPANLLAAIRVAASPAAADRGALVVINDEIHLARTVRKMHTSSLAAFASPSTGPVGRVHEGRVVFFSRTSRPDPLTVPTDQDVPRVALLRVVLGSDTQLLDAAAATADGLVVEALGGGHVPSWWEEPLRAAARRMPVILASRSGSGLILESTYDFPGSERRLIAAGLISAGSLDGAKARMLLILAMMAARAASETPNVALSAVAEVVSRHTRHDC